MRLFCLHNLDRKVSRHSVLLLTLTLCVFTADKTYYIISGQHRFEASRQFRERENNKGRAPPQWAVKFNCDVLKEGLSLTELQRIAGRLQAQQGTVRAMTVAETMAFFLKIQKRRPNDTTSKLLVDTFKCTGKSIQDGTPVCVSRYPFKSVLSLLVCMTTLSTSVWCCFFGLPEQAVCK